MLTGHHCSDPFMRGAVSMKSISQVARLTGISVRTLQYYDEIGLLKPSELTSSGYRLYDDNALQTLQQILFFKELGFSLKEIRQILENPDFDRITAFKEQKKMFRLKPSLSTGEVLRILICLFRKLRMMKSMLQGLQSSSCIPHIGQ